MASAVAVAAVVVLAVIPAISIFAPVYGPVFGPVFDGVFDDGSVRTMAKGLATKLHELRTLTNPEIKELLGMIKG